MNLYVDSSAFVKLLVREEGSRVARGLMQVADKIVSASVTYVEARATVAAARRAKRLSRAGERWARTELEARWAEIAAVELEEPIARSAGAAAEHYRLRAHDAIQLASALAVGGDLVVVTWDADLRRASTQAGLRVAPA